MTPTRAGDACYLGFYAPILLHVLCPSYSTSYASSTSSVAVQAMASYNASWTVYVNGNQSIYYRSDGLMPIVGSYSTNFLGYGTSYTRTYFHGSM